MASGGSRHEQNKMQTEFEWADNPYMYNTQTIY